MSSSCEQWGLHARVRDQRQRQWKEVIVRVIVAPNVFVMGIDKDNVRFVAHLDLHDNPEAYFQESGRAGGDGLKVYSIILWEKADLMQLQKNHESTYPPIPIIKNVYQALGNYFQLAVEHTTFLQCWKYNQIPKAYYFPY